MRKVAKIALAGALAAALLSQTGCLLRRERVENAPSLRTQTTTKGIALDGATEGEVKLVNGAGELRVEGGAAQGQLIEGEFKYSPSSLEPRFDATKSGDRQEVVVRNERDDGLGDLGLLGRARFRNTWDIRLSEEVPIELDVTMGAGDSDLDLRDVDIESLLMTMGAGDTTIDLSGERTHDIEGTVEAGAGEVTIRLPKGVGVRVMGRQDGVGEWDAPDFRQDGNYFVNDAYETSDVKIELNVQRGVGEVRLELVD